MDSTYTMNQTRGVPCGRSLVQPAFDVCLLERILSRDNLHAAFEIYEFGHPAFIRSMIWHDD